MSDVPTTDDDEVSDVTATDPTYGPGAADIDAGATGAATDGASPAAPRRRRVDKTLVIVSLVVGLGLALVTRGILVGVTGDDRSELPAAIERVDPVEDAEQVPNQTAVFVDLEGGFTGVLVIDGVEIPTVDVSELADDTAERGQQVEIPEVTVYEPGNATLTFVPSAGAPITEFADGEHTAVVLYWPLDETRDRARTFTWTFTIV